MPGSVEEIQAIVKVGNRYKIKVNLTPQAGILLCSSERRRRYYSTGFEAPGRILEIDEKNLYAVVEPYVICATLQAELMKRGLNLNVIGAGISTSPLASATSYSGQVRVLSGWVHNSENLLAMEWITPTGEIVRTGSLGSDAGWFCGEGPGPSLRGICRGARGARGGMGVYTKLRA